jgi:hypothetical protein
MCDLQPTNRLSHVWDAALLKLLQNWGENLHGKYFEGLIASGGGAHG